MKKILKGLVISTLIFCMTCIPVFASEYQLDLKTTNNQTAISVMSTSTITAPDGKTYTLLGTTRRRNPLKASFTSTLKARDNILLKFYCPNISGSDWVQGKIIATPVSYGTEKTYQFMNMASAFSTVDLSTLIGSGSYRVSMTIYSIGTSQKGTVYYRIEQK
ncbi:hypothetical protein [Clostridium sp. E02]|uniref:hypothetical protein n=1 Tax=Clostridium sp. E02 TaxID=2487134 RepID=UPI000F528791|nr:hypothetical protein [Clostridium sp. E02]